MHEHALVDDLLDALEMTLQEHNGKRVTDIWLELGRASGCSEESVMQAFALRAEGPPLKGATLHVQSAEGAQVLLRRVALDGDEQGTTAD